MLDKIQSIFTEFYKFVMNHIPCKIGRVLITLAFVPVCMLIWMVYGSCYLVKMLVFDTADICREAWNWKVKQ